MNVTNTYTNTKEKKRLEKQKELHRKCILILQAGEKNE